MFLSTIFQLVFLTPPCASSPHTLVEREVTKSQGSVNGGRFLQTTFFA